MAYYRTPHDVTALPAWQALKDHRQAMQDFSMREAFNADPQRFNQFTLSSCGLFLDYSKNLIDEKTLALLVQLAEQSQLGESIQAQFKGDKVNASEGRAALHTALRSPLTKRGQKTGAPQLREPRHAVILGVVHPVLDHDTVQPGEPGPATGHRFIRLARRGF